MASVTCKICGGEVLLENGKGICQNCGTVFIPEKAYENIEVYICYVENDASGRRTKDSIIAQEVYQKLENAKITAFYERVSADGISGDELTVARYAAIQSAKAVLVLGTSVESFHTIAERYGTYLEGKTVIPFCVDVNPGAIPASLSKLQAISYTTIGWDKDLIKGLYNMLGREKELDTGSLYGNKRKKMLVIGIAAAAVLLILGVVALLIFGGAGQDNSETTQPSATTQATTKPLTQQDIYDQAVALMEQGGLMEPLDLLLQIPDHPDSVNKIKLIYASFEGYYQADNATLRLEIADNSRADVRLGILSEEDATMITASASISGSTISGSYRDNNNQTGTVELKLDDTGVRLVYKVDDGEQSPELVFALDGKSDTPTVQLDSKTLVSWVKKRVGYSQIMAHGLELEAIEQDMYGAYNTVYWIEDTEIYLTINDETKKLAGVQAPASILLPSYVGKDIKPIFDGDLIYRPNARMFHDGFSWGFSTLSEEMPGDKFTADTPVGVATKKGIPEEEWGYIFQGSIEEKIRILARKKLGLKKTEEISVALVTENKSNYLFAVQTAALENSGRCVWYKMAKKDKQATYIKEGPYQTYDSVISRWLWLSEYPDFAKEFPDLYGLPVEGTVPEPSNPS